MLDSAPTNPREKSGGKRRVKASELGAVEALNSAATPRLNRSLPSAGPKSDGLFCNRSLLFACLCRSHASRASSSGVCGAQPHAHQWILLQPRVRHSLVLVECSFGFLAASQSTAPDRPPSSTLAFHARSESVFRHGLCRRSSCSTHQLSSKARVRYQYSSALPSGQPSRSHSA